MDVVLVLYNETDAFGDLHLLHLIDAFISSDFCTSANMVNYAKVTKCFYFFTVLHVTHSVHVDICLVWPASAK